MIELKKVTKQFDGVSAVDGVDLIIQTGEVCVLVGSSGCGKSTTLRMINRLLPRSGGQIFVDGQDIDGLDERQLRLNMGYVIQGTGLFPHWTVARNIAMVPRLLKWPRQRINARVDELLHLLGLDPGVYGRKYPQQLSGGQAQRVGVARALAADPDILLMDEPFGALDAITRESLQQEILRIQQKVQKTIVFVTHDIDEALKLATRIAVMDQGRIIQYDTPEAILRRPASDFAENLIGQKDRGLRLLALRPVRDVMVPYARPQPAGPGEWGLRDTDSIRHALSLMLWQKRKQAPVFDADGQEIGRLSVQQLVESDL